MCVKFQVTHINEKTKQIGLLKKECINDDICKEIKMIAKCKIFFTVTNPSYVISAGDQMSRY